MQCVLMVWNKEVGKTSLKFSLCRFILIISGKDVPCVYVLVYSQIIAYM